jgi:hypothetical protein
MYSMDSGIPTRRLQLDPTTGVLLESPPKILFLRGPIPMVWLERAASLPGKAFQLGTALWWLYGMSKGKSFKVTQKALKYFHISRDAASDGLKRLEQLGLIKVERNPGKRPVVFIVTH